MTVCAAASLVDPSENVRQLTMDHNKRQDDLRDALLHNITETIGSVSSIAEARSQHSREVAAVEIRRLGEITDLRASYDQRLDRAESERINALRAVDVEAVRLSAERAGEQAHVLATQVHHSAETLRALVASTAHTVSQAQQQLESALNTRISALEHFQYRGEGKMQVAEPMLTELLRKVDGLSDKRFLASDSVTASQQQLEQALNARITLLERSQIRGEGKQQIVDPMIGELLRKVETLGASQAVITGRDKGLSTAWAVLVGVVGLLGALGVGIGVVGSNAGTAPAPAGQIVYAPAPAPVPAQ